MIGKYLLTFIKAHLNLPQNSIIFSDVKKQSRKYKCLKNLLPDSREGRKKEIMYTRQGIMPNVESFFKIN